MECRDGTLEIRCNIKRRFVYTKKNNSISNLSALKRFAMRIKKQRKEYDKVSLNLFGMAMANNPKTIEKVLFERKDN